MCVIIGGKFRIIIPLVALKTINFEFPSLSEDARRSFLIEFALERLDRTHICINLAVLA